MTDDRLAKGERHRWRVIQRAPFGIVVEAIDLTPSVRAVIDIAFMPEATRGRGEEDLPSVDSVIDAVVQGYTPAGQLRLTMLPGNLGSG
jgi:hypothetical protein